MKLIETSLQIALRAYAGKVDKAGREYILRPLRVMAKVRTGLKMSAALLHDVLEDSEITPEIQKYHSAWRFFQEDLRS